MPGIAMSVLHSSYSYPKQKKLCIQFNVLLALQTVTNEVAKTLKLQITQHYKSTAWQPNSTTSYGLDLDALDTSV